MAVIRTRAAVEALVRSGADVSDVVVYAQLSRKRLLSRGLIFGDLLMDDKALLNIMVRSADGWLTKEQVVQLKFDLHLGDFITAHGRVELTPANEILFSLFSATVDISWDTLHPGVAYSSSVEPTFFTSAGDGSSQTNMVQLNGLNACKYYFNNASCVRGAECQFYHGHPDEYNSLRNEWMAKRLQLKRVTSAIEGDGHDPNEKKMKSARARIFCEWLVATFGEARLGVGSGVLDIAGGRGDLSFELWNKRQIPATLVEPRLRKPRKEHFKHVQLTQESLSPQIQACLDAATMADHRTLFADCSLLVGMHPDEATEAIVDMALALKKPFAIVPCCVMSRLFPDRRTADDGQLVATYDVFVRYLHAKHPQIQSTFLPFAGKNQVLFML
ncbi:Aste57867_784 [Aphanomyces stellatus]|uniref:Aste57867_784 protein n=1 Tax=Aphanomyces stellatus TaxID=120398 RepID=A0A485K6R3_9STRA|nr:hypothetical protein As57867_000783 [Aphanomyces stellatus]VFT78008.1 Aste57867_784 [Aphanomyces stellatus]